MPLGLPSEKVRLRLRAAKLRRSALLKELRRPLREGLRRSVLLKGLLLSLLVERLLLSLLVGGLLLSLLLVLLLLVHAFFVTVDRRRVQNVWLSLHNVASQWPLHEIRVNLSALPFFPGIDVCNLCVRGG